MGPGAKSYDIRNETFSSKLVDDCPASNSGEHMRYIVLKPFDGRYCTAQAALETTIRTAG